MNAIFYQSFVQYAFIVGTIVAITCAIIGYFVVLRSQAFAAHALSHIGFAGATAAGLLGISSLVGMLSFTIVAALGMGSLEKRLQGRDVEIGMILSFVLGLGVLFLKIYANSASEAVSVLFGSIFSITQHDVVVSFFIAAFSIIVTLIFFRPFLFISIDPELAQAKGVPVRLLSIGFMAILAITVAEAIQVVGVLLVFALLISPPSIAQHLTKKPLNAILLAIFLGIIFTWFGIFLSLVTSFPVSFYIAGISGVAFFFVTIVSHKMTPHTAIKKRHPNKEIKIA